MNEADKLRALFRLRIGAKPYTVLEIEELLEWLDRYIKLGECEGGEHDGQD